MASRKSRVRASLLGPNLRTLQPKLRMIANGDATVNAIRAELSAAVKVTNPEFLRQLPQVRSAAHEPLSKASFRQAFRRQPRIPVHLKVLSRDVKASVFIHTTTSDRLPPGLVQETGRR